MPPKDKEAKPRKTAVTPTANRKPASDLRRFGWFDGDFTVTDTVEKPAKTTQRRGGKKPKGK